MLKHQKGTQWTNWESSQTLKSMLKARVDNDPQGRDEQLGYCMMTFRTSVHSSTEHKLFKRIPLDVMIGSGLIGNESSYS